MKKTLIAAMCLSLMLFACGCRGNNNGSNTGNSTGSNMANDAENMVNDAENMAENIAESIFPSELEEKDSEYFKVTEYSTKDNTVTLKGSVMRRGSNDKGGTEYEYGKQDSELTFDAEHAKITYNEEGNTSSTTISFASYLTKHGDSVKDKVFKVKIEDGRVKSLEEAGYNDNK